MLIEIGEDIVALAEKGDETTLEVLHQLANACKYGKHQVFMSIPLLERICRISHLDKIATSIYRKLKGKASEWGVLKNAVEHSAIVTMKNPNNQKQLWIHPTRHPAIELYEETHLLVENLLDLDFFTKCVLKYYQNNHKLSKCPICFFPLQGGGTTIKDVYAREIKLKQHFCLAIVDSDKKYPDDQYGQTSEELKQIHDKEQPFNCFHCRMEKVSEIENLIPVSVVKEYKNNNSKQLFQLYPLLELSFFDMKKGFMCCNIKDEAMYTYWKDRFNDYEDLKNKLEKCHQECLLVHRYNVSKETKKSCCNSSCILDGFGSDLLKDLLHDGASISKLKNVKNNQLTENQRDEWEAIGKIIFEWCCAGQKMRV